MTNIEDQDKSEIQKDTMPEMESDEPEYYDEYYEDDEDNEYQDDYEDCDNFEDYKANLDSDNDSPLVPVPALQNEKPKECCSEIPIEELTDFALEELFYERQRLCYSDGQFYRIVHNHLELIDKGKLEELVLDVLRDEFRRIGKRSRIKAVTDLIRMRRADEFPGIDFNKRQVAFSNHIIDIDRFFSPDRDNGVFLVPPCYTNCMHELDFRIDPLFFMSVFPHGPNPSRYLYLSHSKELQKFTPGIAMPFPESLSIYNDSLRSGSIAKSNNGQVQYEYSDEVEFQRALILAIEVCPTPVADKFFMDIADGDFNIVERIYQMIGYILIPGNEAKAYFLLQGESDSGKSVLGKFLEGYFPPELVTSLDISRLGEKYLPEELATSCLNLSMDLPNGKMSAKSAAVLKMLTGDDLITHEVKYKNAKPYRGRCKFVFSTNFPLEMTVYDEAFLNRTVCIPFKKSISKDKQDPQLLSKLNAERENITIKAIALYYFLKKNNFKFSGADKIKPKVNYRMDVNEAIRSFIETKCSITYNSDDFVSTKELYDAFLVFCNDSGITYNSNINSFSQRVRNLYYPHIEPHRTHENGDFIRGYSKIKVYTNPLVFIK